MQADGGHRKDLVFSFKLRVIREIGRFLRFTKRHAMEIILLYGVPYAPLVDLPTTPFGSKLDTLTDTTEGAS
jgi:hypothetical protein